MEEIPLFRAPKRRKVYRLAAESEEDSAIKDATGQPSNTHDAAEEPSTIVRAQRHPLRRTGVNFTTSSHRLLEENKDDLAQESSATSTANLQKIPERFIGSGGQVVNVDKHMYVLSLLSPDQTIVDRCLTLEGWTT